MATRISSVLWVLQQGRQNYPGRAARTIVGQAYTSPFGPRGGGVHHGIDILGVSDTGDMQMAANLAVCVDGTVEVSAYYADVGYTVKIKVNDKYAVRYCHLHEMPSVKVGQQVKAGQVIGVMGNTGTTSAGIHLHFEVWEKGVRVDPLPFLQGKKAFASTPAATSNSGAGGNITRFQQALCEDGHSTPVTGVWSAACDALADSVYCGHNISGVHQGKSRNLARLAQTLLKAANYPIGSAGADGVIGDIGKASIIKYQRDVVGCAADGVFGKRTWRALLGVK